VTRKYARNRRIFPCDDAALTESTAPGDPGGREELKAIHHWKPDRASGRCPARQRAVIGTVTKPSYTVGWQAQFWH
jgi:hypothetical protein